MTRRSEPWRLTVLTAAWLVYLDLWALLRIAGAEQRAGLLAGLALLNAAFLLARLGAGLPRVRAVAAVAVTVAGCAVVTGQLRVEDASVADAWFTSTAASTALVLVWRRRTGAAAAVMGLVVLGQWLWGGWAALEAVGSVTSGLLVAMVAAGGRALAWFAAETDRHALEERAETEQRTAQDAYRTVHQQRIEQTGVLASEMLQRIVDGDGRLIGTDRRECRVLHQSIRDETRGRHLLNDRLRAEILRQRRRGAVVQVLDDGDLGDLDPRRLSDLLDEVADAIAALGSDRIVIRSGPSGSDTAVTVIASSVDPIAEALGLDTGDDDPVDLWLRLPRVPEDVPAGSPAGSG